MENIWELSKENVLPIKQGRAVCNITAAKCDDGTEKREQMRREFEAELRDYTGPDPLSIWFKYILWLEQSYPEGGEKANLSKVFESCIQSFYDNPLYKEDSRFLGITLRFAKHCVDPLEIFAFLYDKEIGSSLAEFYTSWAYYLENFNNIKKADEILEIGLRVGAEPKSNLVTARMQLQVRLAKAVVAGDALCQIDTDEEKRQALSSLKMKAQGVAVAPVSRVGRAVNELGALKSSSTSLENNKPNACIQVYVDENNEEAVVRNPVKTGRHFVADQVGNENRIKPGKWCDNKLKQRTVAVNQKPEFDIHTDPDESDEEYAYRQPESHALKVRKKNPDSPPVARFEKLDTTKRFYFDERKIYAGGTEFSFEEIRGRKWLAYKRRQAEKEQSQKLKSEVEALKLQVAILLNNQQNQTPPPEITRPSQEPQEKLISFDDNAKKLISFDDNATKQPRSSNEASVKSETSQEPQEKLISFDDNATKQPRSSNEAGVNKLETSQEPQEKLISFDDNATKQPTSSNEASVNKSGNFNATSIIVSLWNGSIAPEELAPEHAPPKVVEVLPKKDFSIFKDTTTEFVPQMNDKTEPLSSEKENYQRSPTLPNENKSTSPIGYDVCDDGFNRINDSEFNTRAYKTCEYTDAFTFALPGSVSEFVAPSASTPGPKIQPAFVENKKEDDKTAPQLDGVTAKLSPIVETSREYKSSSSSSSSSAYTTSSSGFNRQKHCSTGVFRKISYDKQGSHVE